MKHPAGPAPASTRESARTPPPARSFAPFLGSTTPRALRPATAVDTLLISTTSPGFQTPPNGKDGRVALVNSSRDKENSRAGMGETAPEVGNEGGLCSICLSPLKKSGSTRRQEQREVYTVRLCKVMSGAFTGSGGRWFLVVPVAEAREGRRAHGNLLDATKVRMFLTWKTNGLCEGK